jgi:hypothetical membrane protein
MRRVPWWAVLSAAMAPVFLIGGWTLGAVLQPAGYSPVRETISALAGQAAPHREVMTVGLAGLGMCHVVTAAGLRAAAGAGRFLLTLGGVATVLVAAFPVPSIGTSNLHGVVAGIGFVTLGLWPALAWRRGRAVPWGLRPLVSIVVAAMLLGLLGWFAAELFGGAAWVGLSERSLAGAQASWPLAVVLSARRFAASGSATTPAVPGKSTPA